MSDTEPGTGTGINVGPGTGTGIIVGPGTPISLNTINIIPNYEIYNTIDSILLPLPVSNNPSNTFEFVSKNLNVVEIFNGTLKIKGVGIAIIDVTQPATTTYLEGKTSFTVTVLSLPCLLEGTKIETEGGYKCIETLDKEDKVKTVDGYKNVYKISHQKMEHRAINKRIPDQLYEYTTENEEPLILTGRHSILVDSLTTEESKQVKELTGRLYITGKKYRLPACLDNKAKVYDIPGTYNVYHVALENENMYTNYGMYANGVLVETMSKRNIDKL